MRQCALVVSKNGQWNNSRHAATQIAREGPGRIRKFLVAAADSFARIDPGIATDADVAPGQDLSRPGRRSRTLHILWSLVRGKNAHERCDGAKELFKPLGQLR